MRQTIRLFFLIVSGWLVGILSVNAQKTTNPPSEVQFPAASQFSNSKLTYKIISAPKKTFCYDIYADGRLMIHQPSAPGLPGNEGFKTKADAEKVAKLVIDKIKKGEMPPSVTKEEMEKLKVL